MAREVKNSRVEHGTRERRRRRAGPNAGTAPRTTTVSRKNQITIPVAALRAAGLSPGDVLRVEALSAGRLALTRVDELLDRYAGALDTGGRFRGQLDELRDEWR